MKLDGRGLVDDLILTFMHRPHYLELPLFFIFDYYHCRGLVPSRFYLLAPSLWYFALIVIYGKYHEFSIF